MSIAIQPEFAAHSPSTAEEHVPLLSLAAAGIRMTTEEFDAIDDYDDEWNYELINEVLVVTPIPLHAERGPNELLGHWLMSYRDQNPQTSTLDDTFGEEYVRVPKSRRRADRVIWAGLGRRPKPKTDVPTIVVEFVSKGRRNWMRDYVEKRDEYLALGVKEYWIVNRFERTLSVPRTGQSGVQIQVVKESEIYATALLPGFELPLAQLLAAAFQHSGIRSLEFT